MTDTNFKPATEGNNMTTTPEAQTETKTVAEEAIVGMAQVSTVDFGLPATHRCDSCGAQAYVEVEIAVDGDKKGLLFCSHDYTRKGPNGSNEDVLMMQALRIVDHRPFLVVQEAMFKGGQPVK